MTNAELNYIMADFKPIADKIRDFIKRNNIRHVSIDTYTDSPMIQLNIFSDVPNEKDLFGVEKCIYLENEIITKEKIILNREA